MKAVLLWLSFVGSVFLSLVGCPPTMESVVNKLQVRNDSDTEIIILLNLHYPDSTLAKAFLDRYMSPRSKGYVGNRYELEDLPGLGLLVFDHAYFKSRWHEGVGTPDTYLAEDKILKRWVLSKQELDSLNWVLRYP